MKINRFLNTKNFQQLPKSEKILSYSQTSNLIHLSQQRVQNKCINLMTKDGKKTKAYSLFNTSLIQVIKMLRHSDIQTNKQSLKQISSAPFEALSILKNNQKESLKKAQNIFQQSINNVKPFFEVRKVRIAGKTLMVPALIRIERQENIALRWILEGAKERKKKNSKLSFGESLAIEILEASNNQGYAKQKRDELHKIAEANRAFSHYKWW